MICVLIMPPKLTNIPRTAKRFPKKVLLQRNIFVILRPLQSRLWQEYTFISLFVRRDVRIVRSTRLPEAIFGLAMSMPFVGNWQHARANFRRAKSSKRYISGAERLRNSLSANCKKFFNKSVRVTHQCPKVLLSQAIVACWQTSKEV